MRRILSIRKNKTCRLLWGIFKKQPAFFGFGTDVSVLPPRCKKKAACTLENRDAGCFSLFNETLRHGVSDTAMLCSAGCFRVGNRIRQPALFRRIYARYQSMIRCAASTHLSNSSTSAIRTKPLPGLPLAVSRAKKRPGSTSTAVSR